MKRGQEVKRYAKIFVNSTGLEAIPAAIAELERVCELMSGSRELRGLLENPLFTGKDREKVVKELSKKLKLSDNTVRFVIHLSGQRIISDLQDLINFAAAIYFERKKKAKAQVKTAIDVSNKYDDRLKTSLKGLTGRDVDIEYIVDPSLIGGMIIKVGSTMYDSSIKGQLRLLKDDLMKG